MESFRFDENPIDFGAEQFDHSQLGDPGEEDHVRFASVPRRLGAMLVDYALPWFISLRINTDPVASVIWLAMIANSVIVQGKTGQSLGKKMLGLKLAYVPTDKRKATWEFLVPGVGRCAARYVLHTFDIAIFFAGIIRAFMNPYSQTWADSLCRTVVTDSRVELGNGKFQVQLPQRRLQQWTTSSVTVSERVTARGC